MIEILSILTGRRINNPSSVIEQGFVGNSQFTAGCFIKSPKVYSICKGTVLAVEQDPINSTWTITVEVNSQKWVRYCCISSTNITAGSTLNQNDYIGDSYRGLMRLEYCTADKSQFPVRVLSKQLYKQDPTPIIFGQVNLEASF